MATGWKYRTAEAETAEAIDRRCEPRRPLGLRFALMRIRVETELCQGHGRCYMLAPDLFYADDDGYCHPTGERTVPAELDDQARRALMNCPEDAIILTEET